MVMIEQDRMKSLNGLNCIFAVFVMALLTGVCVFGSGASAYELLAGESPVLAEGDVVHDDLLAFGSEVTIDGTIDGDLISAAGNIYINGVVTGDVIAAGGVIFINGEVEDDAVVAAGIIDVPGDIGDNFLVATGNLSLGSDSSVGRDVVATAGLASVDGDIGRNLVVSGSEVIIDGDVGGFASVDADLIEVGPRASIAYGLNYTSPSEAVIDEGASVSGDVNWTPADDDSEDSGFNTYRLLSMFIFGLVTIRFFPDFTKKICDNLRTKGATAGLVGALMIVLVPLASLFVFFTIVGIPLSLFTMVSYIMTLYVSRIFAAVFIGAFLLRSVSSSKVLLVPALALGLIVLEILALASVLDPVVWIFVYIFSFGSLIVTMHDYYVRYHQNGKKVEEKEEQQKHDEPKSKAKKSADEKDEKGKPGDKGKDKDKADETKDDVFDIDDI